MITQKQQEYLNNATHRWGFKTGATRAGKTWIDYSYVIPRRIMRCKGNGLIVLLGNTQGSLSRNVLVPMRNIWGETLVGQIRTNDNTVQLFGKRCYVIGADARNRVAAIQGSGIEYCYGDEVTTWAEEVFQMLKSRLDKPNSRFDGTCNPDSPNHWVKQFLESDADIYHQTYHIDDNPSLDPEVVANLKREYTGIYYQRYIQGLWTLAEGAVYDMWDDAVNLFDISDLPKRAYTRKYVAIDYGTTNPMVYLLAEDDDTTLWITKEYYYDSRKAHKQKTDEQYADDFDSFVEKDYSVTVTSTCMRYVHLLSAISAETSAVPGASGVMTPALSTRICAWPVSTE